MLSPLQDEESALCHHLLQSTAQRVHHQEDRVYLFMHEQEFNPGICLDPCHDQEKYNAGKNFFILFGYDKIKKRVSFFFEGKNQ